MPARLRGLALLLLPILVLTACDSGDDERPRIGVSGRWTGELVNTQDMSQVFPVDLTMVDTGSSITGSGVIQLPTEALAFDIVRGLFAGSSVNVELLYDRAPFQGSLSGNVSPERDAINGSLSGPGLANGNVMLSLRRAD